MPRYEVVDSGAPRCCGYVFVFDENFSNGETPEASIIAGWSEAEA